MPPILNIPLEKYLPTAKIGDWVTAHSRNDGDVRGQVGFINVVRPSIFIFQNSHQGSRPSNFALATTKYSWVTNSSNVSSIDFIKHGEPPLMVPKPWVDKSLPAIGPGCDLTKEEIARIACKRATTCKVYTRLLRLLPKELAKIGRIPYADKIKEVNGDLVIVTRPGLVREDQNIEHCRMATGWEFHILGPANVRVLSRDARATTHPNVNSGHNLCLGNYASMVSKSYRSFRYFEVAAIIINILYGEGLHGFNSWNDYFRHRDPGYHESEDTEED